MCRTFRPATSLLGKTGILHLVAGPQAQDSRDSLVAVFLNDEINSEQNRLSPPPRVIVDAGISPFWGWLSGRGSHLYIQKTLATIPSDSEKTSCYLTNIMMFW